MSKLEPLEARQGSSETKQPVLSAIAIRGADRSGQYSRQRGIDLVGAKVINHHNACEKKNYSLLNYIFYFIMTNSEKEAVPSEKVDSAGSITSPVGGPHKGEFGTMFLSNVDEADFDPDSQVVPIDILQCLHPRSLQLPRPWNLGRHELFGWRR